MPAASWPSPTSTATSRGSSSWPNELSASTTAADCVAGTLLRYAAAIESEIDSCSRNKLRAALQAGNGDLRELLVAITRTASFQYRRTGGCSHEPSIVGCAGGARPCPCPADSRRSLLKSIGMAVPAVALPVLRSSPLYAQTAPVRLIVLFKGNGTILESFWPSGPGGQLHHPGRRHPGAADAVPGEDEHPQGRSLRFGRQVRQRRRPPEGAGGLPDRRRGQHRAVRRRQRQLVRATATTSPSTSTSPASGG